MDGGTLGLAVVAAGAAMLYALAGCHTVPEGHVGAYWQFGRLLPTVSSPGMHFTWPGVTRWEPIQITMQTDKVKNIPCGTKGGAVVHFERMEVVNRLRKEAVYSILTEYGTQYDKTWIYDKLHHEMNQFCSAHTLQEIYIEKFADIDEVMMTALQQSCSKYAPGIDIIAVRVTKPKIPDAVIRNYEAMEEQRTKVMVAQQTQALVQLEAETKKQKEIMETEIMIQKQVLEMEAQLNVTRIQNMIKVETEKAQADADFYRLEQQAAANKMLHTTQYVSLAWAASFANTSKVYFGPSLSHLMGSVGQAAARLFEVSDGTV